MNYCERARLAEALSAQKTHLQLHLRQRCRQLLDLRKEARVCVDQGRLPFAGSGALGVERNRDLSLRSLSLVASGDQGCILRFSLV